MTSGIKVMALAWIVLGAGATELHITPTVKLVSRARAVRQLLDGASKFFQRDVTLSNDETRALKSRLGWSPENRKVRFFVGRDADGQLVGSAILVKVNGRHGPVAIAVGFNPAGRVQQVIVTHATEETVPWVREILKTGFLDKLAGVTESTVNEPLGKVADQVRPMPRYIGAMITRGVQRALALHEIASQA